MSQQVPQFHLTTRWKLQAPVGSVWTELTRPEGWPAWWKGVLAVELLERGDSNGVGAYRRMTWRGALPYRLAFNMRTVRIEPRALIEAVADGELSGTGRWQLARSGRGTDVQYDWIVDVTKPWMRAIGPIARPLFEWNHSIVMAWGRRGLERRIGIRLT
jgi:uncharacterized protein YndB with AHSA1/START domain